MTSHTERVDVTTKAGETVGYAELATVTHDGKDYTEQGAFVTDAHLTAYCGKDKTITLWDGTVIGSYRVTSAWRVRSYIGSMMNQVRITLADGRVYTGRTFGEGMSVNAKRTR